MGLALECTVLKTGTLSAANGNDSLQVTSTVDTGISWANTGPEQDGGPTGLFREISESFFGIAFMHMYLERWKNNSFERDDLLATFDVGRYGGNATDYRDLSLQNDENSSAGAIDGRSSDNIVGYSTAQNGTYYKSSNFPRHDGSGGWGLHHDREDLVVGQNYKYRLRFEYGIVVRTSWLEPSFEPGIPNLSGVYYECPLATSDFTYRGVSVSAQSSAAITSSDCIGYSSFTSNVNYSPLLLDYIISDFAGLSSDIYCHRPTVTFTAPAAASTLNFYINGVVVDSAVVTTSGTTTSEVTSNSTLRTNQEYTVHLDGASSVTRGTTYSCKVRAIKAGDSSTYADSNDSVITVPSAPTKATLSATDGQYEVVTCTWTANPSYYYQVRRGSTVIRDFSQGISRHQDPYVGSATYRLYTAKYDPYYDNYLYSSYSTNAGSAVAAPSPPNLGVTNCSMLIESNPANMIIGADGLSEASLRGLSDPYFSNSDQTVYSIYEETTTGSLSSTLRSHLANNAYIAVGIDGVVKSCLNPVLLAKRQYSYRQSGISGKLTTSLTQRFDSSIGDHGFGSSGSPYFDSDTTYSSPSDQVKFYILNIDKNGNYQAPSGSATDIYISNTIFRVGNYNYNDLKPLTTLGVQTNNASIGNNGNQALNYFDDMIPTGYSASTVNNSYFLGAGAVAQVLGTSGGSGWMIDPNKGRISRNVGGQEVDWWNAASGRTRLSYDSGAAAALEVTSADMGGSTIDINNWVGSETPNEFLEIEKTLSGTSTLDTAAIPGGHASNSLYMLIVSPKTGGSLGTSSQSTSVILTTLENNVRENIATLTLQWSSSDDGVLSSGSGLPEHTVEPAFSAANVTITLSVYRSSNTLYIEREDDGTYVGALGIGGVGAIAPPAPPTVWGTGASGYTHTFNGLDVIIRRIR